MVRTAALISTVIFAILFVGQGLFPQFYPRPLALHHLPLLFAVAFLPRLLGWGLILAIDWFRRRKT